MSAREVHRTGSPVLASLAADFDNSNFALAAAGIVVPLHTVRNFQLAVERNWTVVARS